MRSVRLVLDFELIYYEHYLKSLSTNRVENDDRSSRFESFAMIFRHESRVENSFKIVIMETLSSGSKACP